jgi:hypothetical protein
MDANEVIDVEFGALVAAVRSSLTDSRRCTLHLHDQHIRETFERWHMGRAHKGNRPGGNSRA